MGELHRLPEQPPSSEHAVVDSRGQLRKAYKPSEKVRAEWKKEGQRREDPGYSARWMVFWSRVVRAVASFGAVGAIDMNWVDEYVRRCRLSELHLYEAMQDPYQSYESGYVAAHPGFAQSRAEAKAARALANDLGLTPAKRRAAGIDVPRPDSRSGGGFEDDQLGPDGEPL